LVRALPTGVDSTELGAAARAERALSAFAPRAGALARIGAGPAACAGGVEVVVVDDIVTTGATLGAVAAVLAGCGVGVGGVAVVAATPRRRSVTDGFGFSSGQTADFRRRPFYALGNHSDPRGHPRSASPGTS
jgi:hypothetical protein